MLMPLRLGKQAAGGSTLPFVSGVVHVVVVGCDVVVNMLGRMIGVAHDEVAGAVAIGLLFADLVLISVVVVGAE